MAGRGGRGGALGTLGPPAVTLRLRWERVQLASISPAPSACSRHQAMEMGGRIFVFGGADEGNGEYGRNRCVFVCMFVREWICVHLHLCVIFFLSRRAAENRPLVFQFCALFRLGLNTRSFIYVYIIFYITLYFILCVIKHRAERLTRW